MSVRAIKRALISVYDKTGIIDFARSLTEEFGIEIISTGATAATLGQEGIPVTPVEEVTGFPEMMDGRVKTLHPKIHAGILADRDNPDHMGQLERQGIKPIDMVVVNLYPFERTIARDDCTFEQAIEMIDIGGPCLLRAAAKNHRYVLLITDPALYPGALRFLRGENKATSADLHRFGAVKAFSRTAAYDGMIATWLSSLDSTGARPRIRFMHMEKAGPLRYGENPHQEAELLRYRDDLRQVDLTVADAGFGSQKQISHNNYLDANAAVDLCEELTRGGAGMPCCVFVKHTNACGASLAEDRIEAYRRAYLGDPNAAMGGILAVNFAVDVEFAEAVMTSLQRWGKDAGAGAFFVEVWIAPFFDADAVEAIKTLKPWGQNVRLLVTRMDLPPRPGELDFKKISGGVLLQDRDTLGLNEDHWKIVTRRPPSDAETADLRLAWLVCKHTKSNAITICKDNMLLGSGAGQMSRVMSCRIATWLAEENGHAERLSGAAAASDAFFPFSDGPTILFDAGVRALIQPGGSKRDEDTIKACDERDIAMIFTGTRHFKH